MSVFRAPAQSALTPAAVDTAPRRLSTSPVRPSALMSDDVSASEKPALIALTAHDDARALVRLIQCRLCSKPFRFPVTLPCGNTLCRQCLPQAHLRENITYPDLPQRRHAIQCPFADCEKEHPIGECNVDVTLSKIMGSIAEIVAASQLRPAGDSTTVVEESLKWDEIVSSQPVSEKARSHSFPGGRLVATYLAALNGHLYRATDVAYPDSSTDEIRALDKATLSDLVEATHNEVTCQVCYNVMLDPITTFCGHTLCRKCLARVLDHTLHCPVCRRDMHVPPSLTGYPSNKALVALLNALCPEAVAARATAFASEDAAGHGELNTPLFICTLAFPHMPTFLRIFEPRYRLMLRRCLEGNREFGMLMYNRYGEPQGELGNVHFYQYGTMLRIVHSQTQPDGQSLVETRGIYRFRVRAHGIHDGYSVGNVERLEDVPLHEEERLEAEDTAAAPPPETETVEPSLATELNRMSTQNLLALGHAFVERMRARSAGWLQQRVFDSHGQPPDDAALFPYWFACVLPISEDEKYKLLATTTVRERLKITATWIRRLESQRWYQSNACTVL